jgi:hypothetical protein
LRSAVKKKKHSPSKMRIRGARVRTFPWGLEVECKRYCIHVVRKVVELVRLDAQATDKPGVLDKVLMVVEQLRKAHGCGSVVLQDFSYFRDPELPSMRRTLLLLRGFSMYNRRGFMHTARELDPLSEAKALMLAANDLLAEVHRRRTCRNFWRACQTHWHTACPDVSTDALCVHAAHDPRVELPQGRECLAQLAYEAWDGDLDLFLALLNLLPSVHPKGRKFPNVRFAEDPTPHFKTIE